MRLFVCLDDRSIEVLPDYDGPMVYNEELKTKVPQFDDLLEHIIAPHRRKQHSGHLLTVADKDWKDPETRDAIVKQIKDGTGAEGLGDEAYAVRDTLQEGALQCFSAHNRPQGGCIDWHDRSKRLGNLLLTDEEKREAKAAGLKRVNHRYLCDFCLSYDTEVVTRSGLRPIGSLVGRAELLVPTTNRWSTPNSRGIFQDVEVRSFGEQELVEVNLQRGKARKTVHATAEHRWVLQDGTVATSRELQEGARLKGLKATGARGKEQEVPFAVAQGFVFGDGTVSAQDRRPAKVVFHGAKDKALLPYFALHEPKSIIMNGDPAWEVYGLPRSWKSLPDIEESRSFLFSWLAGYFAADGTVDKRGSASISSARREHIGFVRSVAAVCGVGTGIVSSRSREGFPGREPSDLFTLTLHPDDLPEWFWVVEEHRSRVEARSSRTTHERGWKVASVVPTGVIEEVFCALVPGVEAFALADDLMTGNCPVASHHVIPKMLDKQGWYK